MSGSSLHSMSARLTEAALAILLVLVFFAVITVLLGVLFPSGARLQELFAGGGQVAGERGGDADIRFDREGSGPEAIAVLASVHRDVKRRGGNSIAWQSARAGADLQNRDGVQTLNRSRATIDFTRSGYLNMGPNSTVVLKSTDTDVLTNRRRSLMLMTEGELEASLGGSGADGLEVELETPGGVTRIRSGDAADGEVRFRMNVNEDHTSTLAVEQGSAEIWAAGERLVIAENQYAVLDSANAPVIRNLARPPRPERPGPDARFSYRDLPPRITFSWTGGEKVDGYRFQLASDPRFAKVLEDRTTASGPFVHGNLKPGTYYWRVRGVRDEVAGRASPVRRLRVAHDAAAPGLRVEFPEKVVTRDRVILRGRADPGSRVFVGEVEVETAPGGGFEHEVTLRRGVNVIVVEAMDAVGNITYRSRTVNGKF